MRCAIAGRMGMWFAGRRRYVSQPMRTIRIILQLVIVIAGGFTLAVLISTGSQQRDWMNILVFLGFVAFLLALTFLLREHTESRLHVERKLNPKPFGIVLLLLGAFGIFHGLSYFIGSELLPTGQGRCRAICGVILLVTQSFGEPVGRMVAGLLWCFVGSFLFLLGYKIKSTRA